MKSNRVRTQEGWVALYQKLGAYWEYGNLEALRPYHALLASGLHSNGFFLSRLITDDPETLTEVAKALVFKFTEGGGRLIDFDKIVGPATGATKLAEALAKEVTEQRGFKCGSASPVKSGNGKNRVMTFQDSDICMGDRVLLCEDVFTTGESIELTSQAVNLWDGATLPAVLSMVNRSAHSFVDGRHIFSLVEKHMPTWEPGPEACPLCKLGSVAIKPKNPESNWVLLQGFC